MSRHRFVRNLDLDEEMKEDSGSDYGNEWDDMTVDQRVQMDSALAHVRSTLGPQETSGFSDKEIKDSLWYYYFDAEKTISWLLEERTKAEKKKNVSKSKAKTPTPAPTPAPKPKQPKGPSVIKSTSAVKTTSMEDDLAGMNLEDTMKEEAQSAPLPKTLLERTAIIEEVKKKEADGKGALSLVVVGHVDAGKSTLMGRLLYELGVLSEKEKIANERGSEKMGKSSFQYAWALDGTVEERERGVTMDIAQDHFTTPNRHFTLLDAPGHRDFIPNMISGASQADAAMLVVDASTGEFESGFGVGGQTREHALLVRSLGVQNVIVVVNKLDTVEWSVDRFDDIEDQMRPFLVQCGFLPGRTTFVPVGAMQGINLAEVGGRAEVMPWYDGPTLVDRLDALEVPLRALDAPLRIPLSNVFKGQTSSGVGVAGRVCSGVVQVGEKLRTLPGDESGIVRSIEVDEENVPWAVAGTNVTIFLASIDPIHLSIGSVLCPQAQLVPQVTSFVAQIILFDIEYPITSGTLVELFHHSANLPASVSKLVATLDRSTGKVIKEKPRVLTRNTSARVEISLRSPNEHSSDRRQPTVSLEPFSVNKEMGRILLRRGGETVGAGVVVEILA